MAASHENELAAPERPIDPSPETEEDLDVELHVNYDESHDLMNVSIGPETEGFLVEMDRNFFLKLSAESGEVIGYTILSYSDNVHKNRDWSDKLHLTVDSDAFTGSFYGEHLHGVAKKHRKLA